MASAASLVWQQLLSRKCLVGMYVPNPVMRMSFFADPLKRSFWHGIPLGFNHAQSFVLHSSMALCLHIGYIFCLQCWIKIWRFHLHSGPQAPHLWFPNMLCWVWGLSSTISGWCDAQLSLVCGVCPGRAIGIIFLSGLGVQPWTLTFTCFSEVQYVFLVSLASFVCRETGDVVYIVSSTICDKINYRQT